MKKFKLRKNEAGYVLIWVLVLVILGGLILGPLLLLMNTALTSSHSHENRMQSFYAADAGIEDAAYKIQNGTVPESYPYYIDVNGNKVAVTIEMDWLLHGFETEARGTTPHEDFVAVVHAPGNGTYEVGITYNGTFVLQVDRIAAWLPAGFSYVTGSSNLKTTLSQNIDDTDTTIEVASTAFFPREGVIWIEGELIQYTQTTPTKFKYCTRGFDGTTVALHSIGKEVIAEPEIIIGSGGEDPFIANTYGGTVLRWDFGVPQPKFDDFPSPPTLSFEYTPTGVLDWTFAWMRTKEMDIYLAWSGTCAIYKATATAQDADGRETTVVSHIIGTNPVQIVTYTFE